MILTAVITVIAAYLIGSINFAVIFSNLFLKRDIRNFGSGNAGTTNVMRTAGMLPGVLTFICDALKGFAACMIGKMIFDYISSTGKVDWAVPIYGAYLCGVACMLGHVFPIFFQFKGGKGVATSVGIFAVCSPLAIVIGLLVFAVVTLVSKMVSAGSITAAFVVVALSIVFANPEGNLWVQIILSVAMGTIVCVKHSANIKRIIAGNENKISLGRHK